MSSARLPLKDVDTGVPAPAEEGATPHRLRSQALWVVPAAVLALVGVATGLWWTGAAGPPLLGDPGPLVRRGLPVVTVAGRLVSALTLGAFVLCACVLPSGAGFRRCRDIGVVAASAWAVLAVFEAILTQIQIIGQPLETLPLSVLASAPASGALLLAAALTACCAVCSLFVKTPRSAAAVGLLAFVALIPIAETGHAAGGAGHGSAATSMWLHLMAVGAWTGGLAALLLVRPNALAAVAPRFSRLAGWCFLVVAFSGTVNAWTRMDSPSNLLDSSWGHLLLVKVVAFTVLGVAGYLHRARTISALTSGSSRGFARLAAGELLVIAATFGLSVALGASAPPTPDAPSVPQAGDAALVLTGAPLPPEPSVWQYLTQWRIDPVLGLLGVAGIVVYLRWVRRLQRRGDHWPAFRTICAVTGLALFVWVTSGGPAVYGMVQFSAHMAQHLALVTILPIFYALSAPATLALRALPRRSDDSLGPREWLLTVLHSRWGQFFAHPVVASVHVVVSMLLLYATPFFRLTLTNHWAHVFMVIHISIVGYLFINALIGRDPGPKRPPYGVRLALLAPPMFFHTFFGLTVMSSTSLLAADFYTRLDIPWLTDPLLDQQIGGALTWAVGELPTLGVGLAIAARWALDDQRARERPARRNARPRVRLTAPAEHEVEIVEAVHRPRSDGP